MSKESKPHKLLASEHQKRVQQRTRENLHLVAAALTDPKDPIQERRRKAEEMALEAMRKLRKTKGEEHAS